ncbi:hypothetical protein B0H12DRAFT_781602 [Mycena haematopus]|nr:hypothetical protein B0H12DRAFT_781602 [Mycena haematopus]
MAVVTASFSLAACVILSLLADLTNLRWISLGRLNPAAAPSSTSTNAVIANGNRIRVSGCCRWLHVACHHARPLTSASAPAGIDTILRSMFRLLALFPPRALDC